MVNNYSWDLDSNYIAHYGVPHGHGPNGGSGRYPWGSGAKWGKTPLGRGIEKVKGFFKKKKPTTSNVETSEAKREVNTSLAAESEKAHELNERIDDMILTLYTDKLDKERGNTNPHLSDSDNYKNRLSELMAEREKDNPYYQIPEYREKANRYEELHTLIGRYFEPKFQAMEDNYKQGSQKYKELEAQYKPIFEEYKKISNEVLNETNKWDEKLKQYNSQKSAESHESQRKAALESGDRNEIAKYFNESSYSELQQALNKANLKDQLNKSLEEAYKATQTKTESKDDWTDYVKQELWSGDLNRIMKVASDKSVNSNDLNNAIAKANTMTTTNRALNPTKADKFNAAIDKATTVLDKAVKAYDSTSQAWNTVAGLYNTYGKDTKKLTMLPTNIKNFDAQKVQEAANKKWESYIKQELWSGDIKRIMAVANDKSVSNKDLDNALSKYRVMDKQLHPEKYETKDEEKNKKGKKK